MELVRREGLSAAPELHETHVSFVNGDVRLAGVVLSLATGRDGPSPGVVIIHGSGSSDRNQAWAAAFARGLAERGFVVLLPDKRGSGASAGDWRTTSFEGLADDAIAAVERLRAVDGVEPSRVGVVGLSQGGHIAPLAASRSDAIAFVIDVSGATVPIVEQIVDEVEKLAWRQGFTQEQVDRVNGLHRLAIGYALTGEGWETYEKALAQALASDLAGHGVVEPFPRAQDHWVWRWARTVGPYDPLPYWMAARAPAMVVFGVQDTQVDVAESVGRLLSVADRAESPRSIVVFGDSGHDLREPSRHRIRSDLLDLLKNWVDLVIPPSGGRS